MSNENVALKEESIKERILGRLNEQQREAAINYQGPCVVNAAPGAGKTATLIARAAYMIEDGVSPDHILLFTFTRKAAKEIKDRVQAQIGEKAKGITVGTYHSFCMRLLRRYADNLGWTKNFSIYDDEDKQGILKPLCKALDQDHRTIAGTISRYKQNLLSPTEAQQIAENNYENVAAQIYEQYMQRMKSANAFDFDDLIYFAIRLLEAFPEVKATVNRKYTHITCDEAHDSSVEDLCLIQLLGGDSMNVCMILDCDQSIYSFRGANMAAVYEFIEDYEFRQFMLERNYRSTQTIVDAARSMIAKNQEPFQKEVYSKNEIGTDIIYSVLGDTQNEAAQVVRTLKAMHKQGYAYKDMAVLYRMQFLSRNVEEALLKNSIPYQVVGGCPFYSRKEIKDIVSYARFIQNPYDYEAFKRIVNTPKRGVGDKSLQRIFSCHESIICDTMPVDGLLTACKRVMFKGKSKDAMANFVAMMEQLMNYAECNSPKDTIDEIIKLTGYCSYLRESDKDKADERIENLMELEEIACAYTELQDFLNNMILNTQKSEDGDEIFDGVNLMTMHASKGLEFPVVIMIGANEGVIPHFKASLDGDVSEERRLFYVAMTRAEKYLFIMRPKIMMRAGAPSYCRESRFVAEINPSYVRKA